MNIDDLIAARRSIRQFQPKPVAREILERFVDGARLAPSAANLQPLEFIIVDDPDVRALIFPALKWAAYISPQGDPRPGHEPQAYVIVLVNLKVKEKMYEYDCGAAIENVLIAAPAEGLGSCWLISIDRPRIAELLGIPDGYKIDAVIALGYPDETSVVEPYAESPRYWKDRSGGFHVPKRALRDVLHLNRF